METIMALGAWNWMILAAVLFLIGIGTTFMGRQIRYGVAGVSTVLLAAALVLIAQQPRPR